MIKLYTAVIPDDGGFSFYTVFSFTLKHKEYLHEATLRNKKKEGGKAFLQTEGQHLACIIIEVVKILK